MELRIKVFRSESEGVPTALLGVKMNVEEMKIDLEKAAKVIDKDIQALKLMVYRIAHKHEDVRSEFSRLSSKYRGPDAIHSLVQQHEASRPLFKGFQLDMPGRAPNVRSLSNTKRRVK